MKTEELIESIEKLYNDIDDCISDIIKGRLDHNPEIEGKALFKMEGLMVDTLQELTCIVNYLNEQPFPEDTVLFNMGVKEGRRLEKEEK